jgi:hypothetical protein
VVVPKDIRACLALDPVEPAYVSLTIGRHHVLLEAIDESGIRTQSNCWRRMSCPSLQSAIQGPERRAPGVV